MVNEANVADQLRTIAQDGFSDEQFEVLLEALALEIEDEGDWFDPKGFFWPAKFAACIKKFGIVGVAPAECAKWECALHPEAQTYFAIGTLSGLIKIGKSRSPRYRVNQLKNDPRHGQPARFLCSTPCASHEVRYHRLFERWRVEGEWFAPHPDILAEIERLTSATPNRAIS